MKLKDEHLKYIADKLESISPDGIKCPVCGKQQWSISGLITEMREYENGSVKLGGPLVPFVNITCNTCGHAILFNAIHIGLLNTKGEIIDLNKEDNEH